MMVVCPPPSPNRDPWPYQATLHFCGLPILVENLPGSTREGVGEDGKKWRTKMLNYYGEIAGTVGSDGEPIDAFVGPDPTSEVVFVIHQGETNQALEAGGSHGRGWYDEDKVMLGFGSEDEALAAYQKHYDAEMPVSGVSQFSVGELRERLESGDLELGAPIVKSEHPEGAGWTIIPGGKHGGYRRARHGAGKSSYDYWYPGHADSPSHKLEVDPTRQAGTGDLKPGELVQVGGRRGVYRWTPEHGEHGAGLTWVTSTSSGEHEMVRETTLFPVRRAQERKKPLPPPPPPPKGLRGSQEPPSGPRKPPPPPPPPKKTPEQGDEQPGEDAKFATPFAGSLAKPGTVLHDIESGVLMLRKIKDSTSDRWREGVHVPKSQQTKFVQEFKPLVEGAARKVAKRYGISVVDRQGTTAAYEELLSASYVGLVMAMSSYTGGSPFVPHAQDYARVYAAQAARTELGAGVPIPDRTMRVLSGFLAARSRARRRRGVDTPTPEQIAAEWALKKKDVYSGRAANLGSYDKGDEIVEQGQEEVPLVPWKVRTPGGEDVGKEYPGKLALAGAMAKLAQAGKVEDSEWLMEHEIPVLPGTQGTMLPVGSQLQVRNEVNDVLGAMKPPKSTALEMAFGFHAEDGEPATLDEIAEYLGLGEGKGRATKRREAGAILDEARAEFERKATGKRSEARKWAASWADAAKGKGDRPGPVMRKDIEERFGTEERVLIYESALRAGEAAHVGAILDAEVRGDADPDDSAWARRMSMRQRDKERLEYEAKFPSGVIDPSRVREPKGTPAESDWLYPESMVQGHMIALVKRAATGATRG